MVGLQIWRGALLLADWLIHNNTKIPKDSYILELGSGVGLTSIVAAMFNPVFCTGEYITSSVDMSKRKLYFFFKDIDKGDILNVIRGNVNRNRSIMKHPIKTLELDFMSLKLPQDVEENLSKISLIIAADSEYFEILLYSSYEWNGIKLFINKCQRIQITNVHSKRKYIG